MKVDFDENCFFDESGFDELVLYRADTGSQHNAWLHESPPNLAVPACTTMTMDLFRCHLRDPLENEHQADASDFTSQRLFRNPMDEIQGTILVLNEVWPVFLELCVRPHMIANECELEPALPNPHVSLETTMLLGDDEDGVKKSKTNSVKQVDSRETPQNCSEPERTRGILPTLCQLPKPESADTRRM